MLASPRDIVYERGCLFRRNHALAGWDLLRLLLNHSQGHLRAWLMHGVQHILMCSKIGSDTRPKPSSWTLSMHQDPVDAFMDAGSQMGSICLVRCSNTLPTVWARTADYSDDFVGKLTSAARRFLYSLMNGEDNQP